MTTDELNTLRALIDRARRALIPRDLERREGELDISIDRRNGRRPYRRRRQRRETRRSYPKYLVPGPVFRCCWCGKQGKGARGLCKDHRAVEEAWQAYLRGEA